MQRLWIAPLMMVGLGLMAGCTAPDPAPPVPSADLHHELVAAWEKAVADGQWRRAQAIGTWWDSHPDTPAAPEWVSRRAEVLAGAQAQMSRERWIYEQEYESLWALTQSLGHSPEVVMTLRNSRHLGDAAFWVGGNWVCAPEGCSVRVRNDRGWASQWRLYPDSSPQPSKALSLPGLTAFMEAAHAAERLTVEFPTEEGLLEVDFDVSGLNKDFRKP